MPRLQMKTESRWKVVVAAVVMQICLGAIYSWGVFLKPIMGEFSWDKTQTSFAFTLFLAMYALGMIIGGRWQDRVGPVRVSAAGGALLGLGYILASFTHSLPWLYLTYGVMGGIGVGLGYICPISACGRWFPDKKGLATGVAVAGFGAGSLLFSPLATRVISVWGWRPAFMGMGILFILVIAGMSRFIKNPPEGWEPPDSVAKLKNIPLKKAADLEWRAMVRTKQFWKLWTLFVLGASSGLMIIGHLAAHIQEIGFTPDLAAVVVGILALTNGAGRILWGMISDRFGASKVLTGALLMLGSAMISFVWSNSLPGIVVTALATGMGFGGLISLFPILSAENFGARNLGINYGILFSAYGVAGLVGPIFGAAIFDTYGDYRAAFIGAGITCLTAALVNSDLQWMKNGRALTKQNN